MLAVIAAGAGRDCGHRIATRRKSDAQPSNRAAPLSPFAQRPTIIHDKQRIAGIPDPNSGGTTVYLSPGVRVGFDRFSGFVSVGVPVINQHNGIQSKPDYRILSGIGARLN